MVRSTFLLAALLSACASPQTFSADGGDSAVAVAAFKTICLRTIEPSGPTLKEAVSNDGVLNARLVGPAMMIGQDLMTWRTASGHLVVGIPARPEAKCSIRLDNPEVENVRSQILELTKAQPRAFIEVYSEPSANGATRDILCRDRAGGGDAVFMTTSTKSSGGNDLQLDIINLKNSCAEELAKSRIAIPKGS